MNKLAPTILVIFGITGDLSRRYLLPALYHLCKDSLLPEQFIILGTSRQELKLADFLSQVELCVLEEDNVCDPVVMKQLRSRIRLVQFNPTVLADYRQLYHTLEQIETETGVCMNRLYYLSIPPQLYAPVIQHLGEAGLNSSCTHQVAATRLVVEKPFGYDTTSARELIDHTSKWFGEEQVFRIDHYLAKETVQNILLFRRHNPAYETAWNDQHITSIDIVAYESLDILHRVFYDQIGALRDLVQSHLLQLLALTTMELPSDFTSQSIHAHKENLLESLGPFPANKVASDTVRGQYNGYPEDVENADSITETFAALQLRLNHPRWKHTTLRIATGKAMATKQTAITVNFRDGGRVCFRIQPKPQIEAAGGPAITTNFGDVDRPIKHADADAYERVLIDAIRGDQTLFATSQEVMACWRVIQPVLDEWAKTRPPLRSYPKGSEPTVLWQP